MRSCGPSSPLWYIDQDSGEWINPLAADRHTMRPGCRFADRCPLVMDVCHTVEPPDAQVDGRMVKCHLFADQARSGLAPEEVASRA